MKVFGLGRMTARSVFKKPETLLYPFVTRDLPEGTRGQVQLAVEGCIFCGMCSRACPCGAIHVDRKAQTWGIERMQCVQCGSCVQNCPKECLSMIGELPAASAEKIVTEVVAG